MQPNQMVIFPMTLGDPNPSLTFCVILHISGMADASLQISHMASPLACAVYKWTPSLTRL